MHAGGFYARKKCTPRVTLASCPGNSLSKGQQCLCFGSTRTLSGLTGVIFPVAEQLCQHSMAAQWSREHGGTDWLLGDPRVTRYLYRIIRYNSTSLTNDITQKVVIYIIWKAVDVPRGIRPQVKYYLVLSCHLYTGIYCASFYPQKTLLIPA